jgi:hypothetical protein
VINNGNSITIHACVERKDGKTGGDLEKISFEFENTIVAESWAKELRYLVYEGIFIV